MTEVHCYSSLTAHCPAPRFDSLKWIDLPKDTLSELYASVSAQSMPIRAVVPAKAASAEQHIKSAQMLEIPLQSMQAQCSLFLPAFF